MQNNKVNVCVGMCVHFCYTGEFNIEEIGQDELEEDSIVESDREEDINQDGLVAEALNRLPSSMSSNIRSASNPQEQVVVTFIWKTCGCLKWKGKPCSSQFFAEYLGDTRSSCFELQKNELDLLILGQLLALSNSCSAVTTDNGSPTPRERKLTGYCHQGQVICATTFSFLHGIGEKRLKNLAKSLRENGIVPRVHGNHQRLPKHTLSLDSIQNVLAFLLNLADQHGLLLPGRIPGYSRSDIKLLPSSMSKRCIWRKYQCAAELQETATKSVAYTSFCRLWRSLLPSVVVMKPMTDLCWQCQKNSTAIFRTSNNADAVKSKAYADALEHLRIVKLERSLYKSVCDQCRDVVLSHFTVGSVFRPPPLSSQSPPNSQPIRVHYSFDYAQQIHYLSDPLQPGPIYFLTPRKCSIFGVHCEALPRQVNFLTGEAGDCGKGANSVLSQLLYQPWDGREGIFLRCDNCTGQNKNSCMIQYLLWRVLTRQHTNICLSFLVVGHTKFAPDWCFGLFKRLFRRSKVGNINDVAKVVNSSAQCKVAQLVFNEDGSTLVPTNNWTDFLAPHVRKLLGIKRFHHFIFDAADPGAVRVKVQADIDENRIVLMKDHWQPGYDMPNVVVPKGLSIQRKWYLFDQIRQFCPDESKDITCPEPLVPRPSSRGATPEVEDEALSVSHTKKRRVCSNCKKTGHNNRSCPTKQ